MAKNIKEENKKAETKAVTAEKTAEADDTAEEISTDELFKRRESIDLNPKNAWFSLSDGGLISLKIINAEGNEEFFERVILRRSFPVTAPDEFISVREPDSRKKGRGAEIGMIRNLKVFDAATVSLLKAELELRYFTPEITKITSVKDKFGYSYWEVETSAGSVSMVLNNPFNNIRVLEDRRIIISDMDGNCFVISDHKKLDRTSRRFIDAYL